MAVWSVTIPAASDDLATLARVKTELGIGDTSQDTALALWLTEASARVAAWSLAETDQDGHQTLAAVTATATWLAGEAPDSPMLYLPWRPPVAVSAVTVDGVALSASGYRVSPMGCVLTRVIDGAIACWEPAETVVTFTGGVAVGAQPDLIRAVVEVVRRQYHAATRDPSLKAYEIDGVIRREFWVQSGGPGTQPILPADLAAPIARWRAPHRPGADFCGG